jgi:hypothetical protein
MRRRSDNQERAVLVKDVMKREVATVGPDASVSLAARLMRGTGTRPPRNASIPATTMARGSSQMPLRKHVENSAKEVNEPPRKDGPSRAGVRRSGVVGPPWRAQAVVGLVRAATGVVAVPASVRSMIPKREVHSFGVHGRS